MDLRDELKKHFRVLPQQEAALKRLGISTIGDILFHFPARYGDTAEVTQIENLSKGQEAVVFGRIGGLKTSKAFRKKIPMSEAFIEDETGRIKIVWFNQAYMAKLFGEGSFVRVQGKVSQRKEELYFSNPRIETVAKIPIAVGDSLFGSADEAHAMYPVYPETRNLTSNWIYQKVQKIFSSGVLDTLVDPIPADLLKKYNLPPLKTALIWIHSPQKEEHAFAARKRFSFEEIFFIQLERQKTRHDFRERDAFIIEKELKDLDTFISNFPFKATDAQLKAIEEILADFRRGHPMARLLEGDVGSGKTAVAAAVAYAITTSRPKGQSYGTLQTAYMVPTEILAQQHFESFIKYFSVLPINIALITGKSIRKFPSKVNPNNWTQISRSQLLKWVANGEISVVIGTHALIQKSVKFKHLALAIIDEQHRFGTAQRQKLAEKETVTPHLLSMTATPIPRTLSLTLYGDLDISLLDQMPAGRKPIITEIITPNKRMGTYERVREELAAGRQVYVICPRIDEPDPDKETALLAKSVKAEALRLKKEVFKEYSIDILHSKMLPKDKEKTMDRFKNGEIDILVATSVVEVGVNVPNASVIIIEGAERYGLSQLHQLRGRVLRGTHQPYCFLFAETMSAKTLERLHALRTAKNGFELAEFDLQQRGAGELYGGKQWGVSDLAMEAIKNLKMVEAARAEATKIIEEDPALNSHPELKKHLDAGINKIHFE